MVNVAGTRAAGRPMGHRTPAINIDSIQKAYILQGTEGDAWNVIYVGDDYSNDDFTAYEVGTVNGKYGIYFAQGETIRFLPLARGIFNPNRTPERAYVAGKWKYLTHSIYNAEDISINKSLTDLFVECDVPHDTELCVSLILDEDPSTEVMVAHIEPQFAGIKHVELPNSIMPVGIKFDAFQIKVGLKSKIETATPTLRGVEVSFRRTLPPGEQFSVNFPVIDQNQNNHLREILQQVYSKVMKSELIIAGESHWVYLTYFNAIGNPDADTEQTRTIQATFQEA